MILNLDIKLTIFIYINILIEKERKRESSCYLVKEIKLNFVFTLFNLKKLNNKLIIKIKARQLFIDIFF